MKTIEPAYSGSGRPKSEPKISSSALGMIAFIGTELMFFAALISAFLIISSAAEAWPLKVSRAPSSLCYRIEFPWFSLVAVG